MSTVHKHSLWSQHPTIMVGMLECPDVRSDFPDAAPGYRTRDQSKISAIVIHHTGTYPKETDGDYTNTLATIKAIYDYHRNNTGWPGIPYHAIVDPYGVAVITGGAETIRYGVTDSNSDTYHIALIGNFNLTFPTPAQLDGALELIAHVMFGLGSTLPVLGHKDIAPQYDPTACPGHTWKYYRCLIDPAADLAQLEQTQAYQVFRKLTLIKPFGPTAQEIEKWQLKSSPS